MAATPRLKVHNPSGEYIASCKHYEDAACLAASYGIGAVIRHADLSNAKSVIWREGGEKISAGESYDQAAEIMRDRVEAAFAKPAA